MSRVSTDQTRFLNRKRKRRLLILLRLLSGLQCCSPTLVSHKLNNIFDQTLADRGSRDKRFIPTSIEYTNVSKYRYSEDVDKPHSYQLLNANAHVFEIYVRSLSTTFSCKIENQNFQNGIRRHLGKNLNGNGCFATPHIPLSNDVPLHPGCSPRKRLVPMLRILYGSFRKLNNSLTASLFSQLAKSKVTY